MEYLFKNAMLGLLLTSQTNPNRNVCQLTARLEPLVVKSYWRQRQLRKNQMHC